MEMVQYLGIVLLAILLKGDYCGDGTVIRHSIVCFCPESILRMGVGSTFKYSIVCCSPKGGR